jgi:transglutaminase-like putative cysteine protease
MRIRAGYELVYECPQPTAMLLVLNLHPSRRADLLSEQVLRFTPAVEARDYVDGFGNVCTRIVAPSGRITVATEFEIFDSGRPDVIALDAPQHDIRDLPDEVLIYLLGSRYCETDRLSDFAWAQFGQTAPGWPRVQAIVDFVHRHIGFDYQKANAMRTAYGGYIERVGVCRDYAHLAITLCRCMNIPARYCTGYLGDIGVPPAPDPMDFSAWFEVFLGGHWHTFDARHNRPRIGRILMATGRDATDVAISTSFGQSQLVGFKVVTEELPHAAGGPVPWELPVARNGTRHEVPSDMPPAARMAVVVEAQG